MMEMKRTRKTLRVKSEKMPERLPDAICGSPSIEFTQISNQMLRDPGLSFKARGILCTLLANHEGQWTSFAKGLEKRGAGGPDLIRTGLKELEEAGYLLRVNYVDSKLKRRRGSFWVYTHRRGYFEFKAHVEKLKQIGCEIQGGQKLPEKPYLENPIMDMPSLGNPRQIIPIINNTKNNNKKTHFFDPKDIPNLEDRFDEFWKLYPRKIDKATARKKWKALSKKPKGEQPRFETIKKAIQDYRDSGLWDVEKYIPFPATWLNKERWEDDIPKRPLNGSAKKPGNVSIGTMNMKSYEGKDVVYPGGENHDQQGDQE